MSSISRSLVSLGLAALAGTALISDASAMRGGGGRGGSGGHFGGHATVAAFHPISIGHGPVVRGPVFRGPTLRGPILRGPIVGGPVRLPPPYGRPPRWPHPIPVGHPWPPRFPGPTLPPVYIVGHPHSLPIIPVGLVAAPVTIGAVGVVTTGVAAVAAPSAPAVCGITGSFVSIVFVPTVTAADITTFLKSYNVTMADGPNVDGVYRIRLSDAVLPAARIAEVLASMRTQTTIVSTVDGV